MHLSYVREKTGNALAGARQWIPAEDIKDPVRPLVTGLLELLPGRPRGGAADPGLPRSHRSPGPVGVGKTTLAIRFARQVGPFLPDGRLYVNLRGFEPAKAPMRPGTALQSAQQWPTPFGCCICRAG